MYYPHIEFQNEAWVKSCLLLWNHVYRIVPEGYTPNDSDEIKALVDADLVRNIKLDDKDREDTFDEFLKLCDKIENRMPAGLIPSDEDRIHPGKIDNRLYPYLDLIGKHFIDENKWLHLSKELARGYSSNCRKLLQEYVILTEGQMILMRGQSILISVKMRILVISFKTLRQKGSFALLH